MDSNLKKILEVSQGEKFSYDTSKTWIDIFKTQVEKNPEKIAVVDEFSEMTYKELDETSDKVAEYLFENGVKENEFVAVRMGRVKEFLSAVLGVQKIGAAYIPIDLDYPAGRVAYMTEDSEAKISLTEKLVTKILQDSEKISHENYKISPENLAYMIYTSGSTGKPKGVMIQHKAMLNFVHFIKNRWGLTENSRIACHSNFAFDASIEDLYPALITGGTVFIVPEDARRDIFEMKKFIEQKKINGGCYTTRFGQMLTGEKALDVDYICLGGEAMTSVPNVRGKVFNSYGPTEFTVDATYFELEKGKDYKNIPIGRPLYNCSAFIVDKENKLLPLGEIGELCLAGPQLAKGYWKRPELTAEKFSEIEVGEEKIKIYHTGDLARYNDDEQLEFYGRIDFQVKLRGFRIELGEIENCAAKFPNLSQVAAEVKNDTLCLYYTAEKNIDEESLKNFMAETLTDYMIPQIFIRLAEMPMTPNGKLDKKSLPDPVIERAVEYVEPRNDFEKNIVDCMKKILGENLKIGAKDNFFEIGGDSIKSIRLVSLLREKNIFLKANDVLKLRSVEKIAEVCKIGGEEKISQEPFEGEVIDTAIFNFYKDLNYPEKNYFNQSTLLELKKNFSCEDLQNAVDKIVFQHDMLRAVIVDDHLKVNPADKKIVIEKFSCSDSLDEIKNLCEEIQSNLILEKSLVRVALIHAGERNLFFITIHHTIIDGVSWRILLSDLEKVLGGENLPQKTNTYQDYAEAMKIYRDSYILSSEIPYWKNVLKKMLAIETSDGKNYDRKFSSLNVSLDKNSTEKFLAAKLSNLNLEVNDLLLTCVGESYREIFGKNSVSVQMEGHGREFIGKEILTDRTVGWFTSIFPVVLENLNGDERHDLISVKETLHRIPNKGVGYNILSFVDGKNNLNFEKNLMPKIIFNYLGNVSGEQEDGKFFAPAEGFSSGLDYQSEKNCDGSDLAINCLIDGKKFSLHLNYNLALYDEKIAKDFAEKILEKISSLTNYLDNLNEKIITASDLGENSWSEEEFNSVVEEFKSRNENLQRIYPLTPLQEGMLLEHVTNPERPSYRLVDIYELNFLPTEKNLRKALDKLAEKHEIFRSAIIHEGVSIHRQAITDRKISLQMVDISEEENKFSAAKKIRAELLKNGFDLQRKPLMQFVCAKTSEKSCYLIIAVHHIIVDGWCVDTYLLDFEKFLQGGNVEKIDSGKYETAVKEILSKDKFSAAEYFQKLLEGYDNVAEIPSYGEISDEEKYFDNQIVKVIDAETVSKFEKVCKNCGATLANGFEMIWGKILQTLCRMDDVVFAKVVSGRDNFSFDVSNLVGLFINSVPVRMKTEKNISAAEVLKNLHKQSVEGNEFNFFPLADVQKAVEMNDGLIFSVMSFENYDEEKYSLLNPVLVKEEFFGAMAIDISTKLDGTLNVILSFDPARYRKSEIETIFSLMENYIEKISENPEADINLISHLNETDEEKVFEISQGKKFSYDTSKTWLDIFKMQVEKNPEKIAVVDEFSEMTYKELDDSSDKIANYLFENGVKENEFVAVIMSRKKEFLSVAVGIQKVGAAYVPIDADYPEDRVNYMLEDSESKIIFTDELAENILKTHEKISPKNYNFNPENIAYMIYTSGSTGKPKGVMIQQKATLNFVYFIKNFRNLSENSRISCHANFSFDGSIVDLYPILISGGTIFVVPEETRRDIFEMRKFIEKNKIDGGFFTTRFGQMLADKDKILDLKFIEIGGEAMTSIPNISGKVFNAYGPTEFTSYTTYFELDKEKIYKNIPIGRPLDNCACFIVDKNFKLLPRGAVGELCVAGSQLSKGYFKRPELTAEKFVEIELCGKKIKVYRTGDLARYNEQNQIEYLGRIDFQVKLRGFRIELGEIENRAAKFPKIIHTVAEVKKNTLCLYYSAEEKISEENFKKFLAESLTDYMIPQIFICMEKMPMTASGKIDRKKLPVPDFSVRQTKYVAPRNSVEKKICAAFEKVLGMEENSVGIEDNFYEIGGDSLKSMQVMLNVEINGLSAKDIFKYRTAKKIAEKFAEKNIEDENIFEDNARKKNIPATVEQIQMIDYQFLNVNSIMYNLGEFYKINSEIDEEKFLAAVKKVVKNHPAFSSIFDFDDSGIIAQSIDENILPEIKIEEISAEELEKISKKLLKPFKLFHSPLFRVKIFKCKGKIYFFFDVHHAISDGTSIKVFLKNIAAAYYGKDLDKDFYYSYLLHENEKLNTEEYFEAKKYFKNLLGDNNFCSYPTTDFESWDATFGEESIDTEISLEKMTSAEKVLGFSRNVLSITAAILALRDYCQQNKIRVNFLNNNRTEKNLQNTVGLIFKILPIAVNLENFPTVDRLMREISDQVVKSFENATYSGSEEENTALRDALLVNYIADMGETNLSEEFDSEEIALTSENESSIGGHVDIYIIEKNDNIFVTIEYQKNAYAENSMKKFLDMFAKHLKLLVNRH